MKVTAVTPVDAASDPLHPNHDRWVKETTLAMEVQHVQRIGGSLRDAETENAKWLERAEAQARNIKPPPRSKKAPRKTRAERIEERGVTIAAPSRDLTLAEKSPCGRCGLCRNCMRERRVVLIVSKRKSDERLAPLANDLIVSSFQASGRIGKFRGLSKRDVARALTAHAETICDASIRLLGEWR